MNGVDLDDCKPDRVRPVRCARREEADLLPAESAAHASEQHARD